MAKDPKYHDDDVPTVTGFSLPGGAHLPMTSTAAALKPAPTSLDDDEPTQALGSSIHLMAEAGLSLRRAGMRVEAAPAGGTIDSKDALQVALGHDNNDRPLTLLMRRVPVDPSQLQRPRHWAMCVVVLPFRPTSVSLAELGQRVAWVNNQADLPGYAVDLQTHMVVFRHPVLLGPAILATDFLVDVMVKIRESLMRFLPMLEEVAGGSGHRRR